MTFMRKYKRKGILLAGLCVLLLGAGCKDADMEAQFEEAAVLLEDGSYTEAAAGFQKVADSGERLPEAYRGLGIAEFYLGNYAEASIALSKSLLYLEKENPEFEKDVNSYLALSRGERMEYEEAISIYDKLLIEYPEAEYYYLRGKCYIAKKDFEAAKKDFDAAAAISTDASMFINIYEIYDNLQMNADGSAYLELGLQVVDEHDYYSRGLIHYYLQEYGNAREVLIESVNKDRNADAMLLLGKVYLAMEDVASARAMYQEYVGHEDVAAEAYNGLALCDIEEGNYDSALAYIQKGLELGDEKVQKSLLYNEICVYEYLNDWETAKAKVTEYLGKYPTDEAAVREQQFLNH